MILSLFRRQIGMIAKYSVQYHYTMESHCQTTTIAAEPFSLLSKKCEQNC